MLIPEGCDKHPKLVAQQFDELLTARLAVVQAEEANNFKIVLSRCVPCDWSNSQMQSPQRWRGALTSEQNPGQVSSFPNFLNQHVTYFPEHGAAPSMLKIRNPCPFPILPCVLGTSLLLLLRLPFLERLAAARPAAIYKYGRAKCSK